MKNITKRIKDGYLYDMILPLFIFEWWNVLLAFIFVVIIETYFVKFFIKEQYKRLFWILFKANLITTVIGYFCQGVVRLLLMGIIGRMTKQFFDSYPVLQGILGNVGIGNAYHPKLDVEVISEIVTSILITFAISVIIERKILLNSLRDKFESSLITKSIIIANVVSYILLTFWICYKYMIM